MFAGACYQPIDRSPAQIEHDIAIMKKAAFTMVRMGDLSWDSFEPREGKFKFEWFDKILAQMHAAGIKVILDIPGLPAPVWLHQNYPSVDIVNQDGVRLHPATRYWDNISDPDYRRLVRQLAEKMLERYAHNPAVVAVGYDNEVGSSPMSYSKGDRGRFVAWLKKRYGTIAALNKAWATHSATSSVRSMAPVTFPIFQVRPSLPRRSGLVLQSTFPTRCLGASLAGRRRALLHVDRTPSTRCSRFLPAEQSR